MNLSDIPIEHRNRIKQELIKAGATSYSLRKMESRYLPEVIAENEHIMAVAYGLRNGFSGVLVATDLRIIYTERKPFYKVVDEISYPMVSGIRQSGVANRVAVILHTRVGDYELRFVNKTTAEKFVHYIDIEHIKQLGET